MVKTGIYTCFFIVQHSLKGFLCVSFVSEQVFTVTVCVQGAAGAQTAPFTVTARMELPALQMMAPASVLQDTEAPPVRGVSLTSAHC